VAGEEKKNRSGYVVTVDRYEWESGKYCRLKKQCTKTKGNRVIERNEGWLRLKRKARKALAAHEELRKHRSVEVETVCGHLKGNQGYRRFQLRGDGKSQYGMGLTGLTI
jgi:ABC-2 type transport system ATP-binding protein/transposase